MSYIDSMAHISANDETGEVVFNTDCLLFISCDIVCRLISRETRFK